MQPKSGGCDRPGEGWAEIPPGLLLMEAGWDWLHLWSRHSCPAPRVPPGTSHPSEPDGGLEVQTCRATDGWHMSCGGLCLEVLAHIWVHGSASGVDGGAGGLLG